MALQNFISSEKIWKCILVVKWSINSFQNESFTVEITSDKGIFRAKIFRLFEKVPFLSRILDLRGLRK